MGCAASTEKSQDLPAFDGAVYHRPAAGETDKEYRIRAYQYATSSYPGACQPKHIIYAANVDDVQRAITYAKVCKVAVAVRSGGHQYLGFSSTTGDNIQLDMSGFNTATYDAEAQTMEIGPGCRLCDITEACSTGKIFFAHGECSHVAAGGHLQTGGYSVFSRSFGMFIDFVLWFDIVTADGVLRKISKPDADKPDADNDDLWWAVLGGSPGNFGVIMNIKVRVIHDSAFPKARGSMFFVPYSKEAIKAFLDIMAEMVDDDETPADYNYNVLAVGWSHALRESLDKEMQSEHPEIYGEDGMPLGGAHPAMVGVQAAWTGVSEDDEEKAMAWFAKINAAAAPFKNTWTGVPMSIIGYLTGLTLSEDEPTPMSVMSAKMSWLDVREFTLPFQKVVYAGTAQDLGTRGFAQWAADKCDEIQAPMGNGCKVAAQWAPWGGKHSMLAKNAITNPTASGHRRTTTSNCTMDYFYHTKAFITGNDWKEPYAEGDKWIKTVEETAVGPNGKFSTDDHRFLYAPWGKECSLDEAAKYYYDDLTVYDRLLAIKTRFDPENVFTPNKYCIGYKNLKKEDNKEDTKAGNNDVEDDGDNLGEQQEAGVLKMSRVADNHAAGMKMKKAGKKPKTQPKMDTEEKAAGGDKPEDKPEEKAAEGASEEKAAEDDSAAGAVA